MREQNAERGDKEEVSIGSGLQSHRQQKMEGPADLCYG